MATFVNGKIEACVGPPELKAADDLEAVIVDFIAQATELLNIAVQEIDALPIAEAILGYQRYPVDVDGKTIHYIVSGGGAVMYATRTIPKVDVAVVAEDDFPCYTLRGDSLAFYSRLYSRKLTLRTRLLEIEPEKASALIAGSCGTTPTRGGTTHPTRLRDLTLPLSARPT